MWVKNCSCCFFLPLSLPQMIRERERVPPSSEKGNSFFGSSQKTRNWGWIHENAWDGKKFSREYIQLDTHYSLHSGAHFWHTSPIYQDYFPRWKVQVRYKYDASYCCQIDDNVKEIIYLEKEWKVSVYSDQGLLKITLMYVVSQWSAFTVDID